MKVRPNSAKPRQEGQYRRAELSMKASANRQGSSSLIPFVLNSFINELIECLTNSNSDEQPMK